ncbi:MAG: endolytic transglycosylase MltG [Deltaproteobacteria bacterium]|nr:MAG: endolytic transglycosylase MltG [Deltaproteobacteria bacterium]
MSKRRLIVASILLVFVLCVFILLYFGYFLMSPAGFDQAEEIFIVEKGSGLRSVATQLEQRKLIKSKDLFTLWAVVKGGSRTIKAGEYSLNRSMAPVQIYTMLTSGAVKTHPLTVPEGLTVQTIAGLFATRGLVDKEEFLCLAMDKGFAASHNIDGPSTEGYLFPDTYVLSKGMGARQILDIMINRFWQVFNSLVQGRDLPMSIREIVTLASIVEKETGLAEERPVIASVFLNRLKKRMRLESDPTVIYDLKDFDGNLTKKHLQAPSPYNTYRHLGLPPGPIANPGRASLEAVLNPAQTSYLYFVSKNDGSHFFSSTLKEHNRAVVRYQKRRR